jgi:oligopeptide transport system permease protein
MHAAPGSPWNREGHQLSPLLVERLNQELGLNQPLPMQYLAWLGRMFTGDMGLSTSTNPEPIGGYVLEAAGTSIQLGIMAFTLAAVVGISLGMLAALRDGHWLGWAATVVAILGMAMPAFALGALLKLVNGASPYDPTVGFFAYGGWDEPRAWVLPTVALAALPMAMIARHTKGSMLEVIHSDYVRTAHSKGLDDRQVATRHLFRNALVPLITVAGPLLAVLITGSIVVERVFDIPGLGALYWGAIRGRDYGLLMGITVVYAAAFAIINAVVDIAYGWIDPRIHYRSANDV